MIETEQISALVLCGGKGQRFDGADKPLEIFNGPEGPGTMVDYVIRRLPQGVERFISANRNSSQYARRGMVLTDVETGLSSQSPLVGIYAGLRACRTPWLLICPGDMPRLLPSWYEPLLMEAATAARPRVLHDGVRLQSLLCLVPKTLASNLATFVKDGGFSVKQWHAQVDALSIPVSEDPTAFANINIRADLTQL